MEKVAVTGRSAGSRWEIPLAPCTAFVLVAVGVACGAVQAQEARPGDVLAADARAEQSVRVQVQTSTLPRFDAQDFGFQAPRVDLSLFPSQSSSLGAVVGVTGFSNRPSQIGLQPAHPSIDLGLRWSQRLQSRQIDITAWRRMNSDDDAYTLAQTREPVYGARVELNLSPSKGPLSLDGGFIGMQLESGAKISIKRKNGGPMIYYRTSF
jgi:hypothetical protein